MIRRYRHRDRWANPAYDYAEVDDDSPDVATMVSFSGERVPSSECWDRHALKAALDNGWWIEIKQETTRDGEE